MSLLPFAYQENPLRPLSETVADNRPSPELAIAMSQSRKKVVAAIAVLPERNRRLVLLRFGFDGEELTLAAIGRRIGVSRERARQIQNDSLVMLSTILHASR